MSITTPVAVLKAIASACSCSYDEIENRLESINKMAGHAPRPIIRKTIAEERLDVIRIWLRTPEACNIIDSATEFVSLNRAE